MYDTHFTVLCATDDGLVTQFSGSAVFDHEPTEDDIKQLPMFDGNVIKVIFSYDIIDGGGV